MQSKAGRPKFASTRFYGFEAQTSSNWTAGDSRTGAGGRFGCDFESQ